MFVLAVHNMINWCSNLQAPARGQEEMKTHHPNIRRRTVKDPRRPDRSLNALCTSLGYFITGLWCYSITPLGRWKEIRDMKQEQPHGSVQRLNEYLWPSTRFPYRRHHRECYQRFTMNLNRISTPPEWSTPSCSKWSQRYSSEPQYCSHLIAFSVTQRQDERLWSKGCRPLKTWASLSVTVG